MADKNRYSIIALVLSLLFFIPLAPLAGLVLGIIALVKINKTKEEGKGLAIAAIIIGALLTLFHALVLSIILVGTFLMTSMSPLENATLTEGFEICQEKNDLARDMCHGLNVAIHAHEKEDIPISYCDDANFTQKDPDLLCRALATKDQSYCEQLTNPNSRNDCIEAIQSI